MKKTDWKLGIGKINMKSNTDLHFKNKKNVNFDIIKNDVDKKKITAISGN